MTDEDHLHDWQLDYIVRDGPSSYSPIKLRIWTCRGCPATRREEDGLVSIAAWSSSVPTEESK